MTMGMPGVTKTSQFSFSIAIYSSGSVLIALLHCNEVAISPPTSGALIRQRFDAAWALAAKQPMAEISANAEAIADSVPWRNASRSQNGSVPVQASASLRRRVRGPSNCTRDLFIQQHPTAQCSELKQQRTVRGSSCG